MSDYLETYDDARKATALSLKGLGIYVAVEQTYQYDPSWPGASHYDVTFKRGWASYTFEFHAGSALSYENPFEFAADVLHCLFSDAQSVVDYDFSEWCEEFGYADEPLREYDRYRSMYAACEDTLHRLKLLFGEAYGTVEALVSEL